MLDQFKSLTLVQGWLICDPPNVAELQLAPSLTMLAWADRSCFLSTLKPPCFSVLCLSFDQCTFSPLCFWVGNVALPLFHLYAFCHIPGIIKTALPNMDREAKDQYLLVIQAKDMVGQNGGLSGTTSVTVTLTDVNDNPPRFPRSKFLWMINEEDYISYKTKSTLVSSPVVSLSGSQLFKCVGCTTWYAWPLHPTHILRGYANVHSPSFGSLWVFFVHLRVLPVLEDAWFL